VAAHSAASPGQAHQMGPSRAVKCSWAARRRATCRSHSGMEARVRGASEVVYRAVVKSAGWLVAALAVPAAVV
jgi:hypothetical protein